MNRCGNQLAGVDFFVKSIYFFIDVKKAIAYEARIFTIFNHSSLIRCFFLTASLSGV